MRQTRISLLDKKCAYLQMAEQQRSSDAETNKFGSLVVYQWRILVVLE
jgi:hypothetical protein